MKQLFVPYEIALKLKEKGFNEPCIAYYETRATLNFMDTHYGAIIPTEKEGFAVDAPLYQQVVDWFREKHKICIWIQLYGNSIRQVYLPCITTNMNPNNVKELLSTDYYYEGMNKAIKKALELI